MPSSRGSSQPRDQTEVSRIEGRIFTIWAIREAQCSLNICDSRICLFHIWREVWPPTEQGCKVQTCFPVRIMNSADVSLGSIYLVICLSTLQAFPDHLLSPSCHGRCQREETSEYGGERHVGTIGVSEGGFRGIGSILFLDLGAGYLLFSLHNSNVLNNIFWLCIFS